MSSHTPNVFVSSTWLDLQPERKAVEAAIQRLRVSNFNGMEYFGSRGETTERTSLDEVDRSHAYVGIFAARYGSGITEAEYRRARERRLPCFIYFKTEASITYDKVERDAEQIARLDRLKDELRQAHIVSEFASPEDLALKVTADLHRWVLDEYLPHAQAAAPNANQPLALHQLPPPPSDFTGRAAELAELLCQIDQGGVTISGLQGLGGIGKTTLALKLAEQLTPRYPDAQFYLDLQGASPQPLAATDALAHVIRAYHPTAKLPAAEPALRAFYLSVLHEQRALLLLDNAAGRKQVEPLIPPASCALLITSRQHFKLPGQHLQSLDKLSPADARRLLLAIEPRTGAHADALAKLCACLPLALRLAASALAERVDLSVTDYVRRLTDTQQRLKLLDGVEASLSLSYDLLSAELQQCWRTLAVFPITFAAPAAAAVWAVTEDEAQDALGELVKYSLLDWDATDARYSLHDLAHLFAEKCLSATERHTGQTRHAAYYMDVLAQANELYKQGGAALMRGLALFDAEWSNIQAGQAWVALGAGDEPALARLCAHYPDAGPYVLHLRQSPRERINWLTTSLAAARGLHHRRTEANHLGNMGLAYIDLGEPRQAITVNEQVLAIMRELGDRRSEGSVLGNIGFAYANLGETERAIEFYDQHLAIAREIGDRLGEGNALGNLGLAYANLGEPRRALAFHEQDLTIAREIGDRRGETDALGNLGLAYADLGETHRAVEFYEQALAIAREIGDQRGEGNVLWHMSLAYAALGDRQQAIALAAAALEIFEQIEDTHADKVREKLTEWRGEAE